MKGRISLFLLVMMLMVCAGNAEGRRHGSSSSVKAYFTKLYLDHNGYENGRKGMYIRYGFEVIGQMDRNIRMVATLYRSNGKPLKKDNGAVNNHTVYFTPGYYDTYYNDQWIFFPYSGMIVGSGRTYCYVMLKLYSSSGRVILSRKVDFWIDR